jgi:hypothetical protein
VFPVRYEHLHIKSKAISITGRGGLLVGEISRIPHCLDSRLTDGGKVLSLTNQPRSTSQKHLHFCLWYSYLLEAA